MTSRAIDLDLRENVFTNIGPGILRAYQLFSRRPKGDAGRHVTPISDGEPQHPTLHLKDTRSSKRLMQYAGL